MNVFKTSRFAQGQVESSSLEEMGLIKFRDLFLGGQITENLISMNLINTSSNFWVLLFTQKKLYLTGKKIALDEGSELANNNKQEDTKTALL